MNMGEADGVVPHAARCPSNTPMRTNNFNDSTLRRSGASWLAALALSTGLWNPNHAFGRSGDVTLDANPTPKVDCDGCESGHGRKLCYDVTLASNAEHRTAKDFHIRVNSANAALFQCYSVEGKNNLGQWVTLSDWQSGHVSSREGGTLAHYLTWRMPPGGESTLDAGETFRFCVVYCGNENNLDSSIEYILTDSGAAIPGVPDAKDNRKNVPDSGGVDDPAWRGTKTTTPGSGTGFLLTALALPPGLDGFHTPLSQVTWLDGNTVPIPSGFFGPGSEPFTNLLARVPLRGAPVDPTLSELGLVDTLIHRLAGVSLAFGGSAQVPVELVGLSLVSQQPISVRFKGGRSEQWTLRVALSAQSPQGQGIMKVSANPDGMGGGLEYRIPFAPRLLFQRLNDGEVRVLDFGLLPGRPSLTMQVEGGQWASLPPSGVTPFILPAGLRIDSDRNPITPPSAPLPGGTPGFLPGFRFDDCPGVTPLDRLVRGQFLSGNAVWNNSISSQPPKGSDLARSVMHQGLAPAFRFSPGSFVPADQEGDGVPDFADNCPTHFNPQQEDRDFDGVGDVCDSLPEIANPWQGNLPPVVTVEGRLSTHAGLPILLSFHSEDPDPNQKVTWELLSGQGLGASVDPRSGLFKWDTRPEFSGVQTFVLRATDDGVPPQSRDYTVLVTVADVLRARLDAPSGQRIALRWNAIPGLEYVVESRPLDGQGPWAFRASLIPEGDTGLWLDYMDQTSPSLLYRVGTHWLSETVTGGSQLCGCRSISFTSVEPFLGVTEMTPHAGEKGSKFAGSFDIKVPLSVVGKLNCSLGNTECAGKVEVVLDSGTYQWLNTTDKDKPVGKATVPAGKVEGTDPKDATWNEVKGACGQETVFSLPAVYSETIDVSKLDAPTRAGILDKTMVLRAELKFKITATCGRELPISRVVKVVVDGRPGFANGNSGKGGWDDGAADYDGDGKTGAGVPPDPNDFDASK